MKQDEGSDTPTQETQAPPIEDRFLRLLSPSEDGGADESEAGAGETKKPAPPTEPPARAAEEPPENSDTVTDEATDSEAAPAPLYKVKVDGEEVEVTLEDLTKSFAFTGHNTRTAQKNAAAAKELEAKTQEARQLTEQYRAVLPKLEEIAKQALAPYEGVDWEALQRDDPEGFPGKYAAYQLEQSRLKAVQDEQAEQDKKAEEEQKVEFVNYVTREEAALLEKVPEWKDETVRGAELKEISDFAIKRLGFTPQDIAETFDHRVIEGLRLAMLGAKLSANADGAKRKISEAKKSVSPGKRPADSDPAADKLAKARENLRKSGRDPDAAAAFSALFESKKA